MDGMLPPPLIVTRSRKALSENAAEGGGPQGPLHQIGGFVVFGFTTVAEGHPERGGRALVLRLRQGVERPPREGFFLA